MRSRNYSSKRKVSRNLRSKKRKSSKRKSLKGGSPGSSRVLSYTPRCNYNDNLGPISPDGGAKVNQGVYYNTSGGGKRKQRGGNIPYNRIFSQLSSCVDGVENSSYDYAPASGSELRYYTIPQAQKGGKRKRRGKWQVDAIMK